MGIFRFFWVILGIIGYFWVFWVFCVFFQLFIGHSLLVQNVTFFETDVM